ncbi:MAG: hypothetical protein DDT35_01521 [Firmicutes bacterium]|nr:hypothetical protein [Bacillota bacterium]
MRHTFLVVALAWAGARAFSGIVALVTEISAIVTYVTSEFAVTGKRVFLKSSVLSIRTAEVLLTKVEGLQVHQGLMGRILGFGSVVVSGSGGTKEVFPLVQAAMELRQQVASLIEAGANP